MTKRQAMRKKEAPRQKETLRSRTLALPDTSKKIRFLASEGKSVSEIEKLLEEFGVTTQDGGHIRYQHVRNVLVTQLTGSGDQGNSSEGESANA